MIQKICLITPSHISSNPRLVKEASALVKAGYKVHLIFTQNLDFLIEHDLKILSENPLWTYDVLNLSKSNKKTQFIRLVNASIQKLAHLALKHSSTTTACKIALNRNYYWQLKKAMHAKADLYIAHNLGVLPIAYQAALKNGGKCGFDAEDFHREELSIDANQKIADIVIKIEDIYLNKVDWITAASPLIAEAYHHIYNRKIHVILNVFPRTKLQPHFNDNEPIRLFWFSQTIGPNRGLENIFTALNKAKPTFKLHLLGKIEESYKKQLLQILNEEKLACIIFHESVAPNEVFNLCNHFNIGLASEPGFSTNNNIALSNKIFTYMQTGLAIVASDTNAQSDFMNQYEDIGFIYPKQDSKTLTSIIEQYHADRSLLRKHQQNAYNLGQTQLNWEIEQQKFISIIKSLPNKTNK